MRTRDIELDIFVDKVIYRHTRDPSAPPSHATTIANHHKRDKSQAAEARHDAARERSKSYKRLKQRLQDLEETDSESREAENIRFFLAHGV